MQQWNTFQSEETTWNNLQNKPTILSDNQVTWLEIQNKPATYPPTPKTYNAATDALGAAIANLISGSAFGRFDQSTVNGHFVFYIDSNDRDDCFGIVAKTAVTSVSNLLPDILIAKFARDYILLNRSEIRMPNIPVSIPNNSGQLWRDSNGFLRIV